MVTHQRFMCITIIIVFRILSKTPYITRDSFFNLSFTSFCLLGANIINIQVNFRTKYKLPFFVDPHSLFWIYQHQNLEMGYGMNITYLSEWGGSRGRSCLALSSSLFLGRRPSGSSGIIRSPPGRIFQFSFKLCYLFLILTLERFQLQ